MARPKKQLTDAEAVKMRDVEAYTHDDKKRTNNPPVGMAQHDMLFIPFQRDLSQTTFLPVQQRPRATASGERFQRIINCARC